MKLTYLAKFRRNQMGPGRSVAMGDRLISLWVPIGPKAARVLSVCPQPMTKTEKLHSRINPILKPGSIVTSNRTTTHYVVTEFGIVNVKGKSTWERAEALISIANPIFRDKLIKDAAVMKIWTKTSKDI